MPAEARQDGFRCEQQVVARVASKDNVFDAVVTERVCSNVGFGSTVILNEISAVKGKNAVKPTGKSSSTSVLHGKERTTRREAKSAAYVAHPGLPRRKGVSQ